MRNVWVIERLKRGGFRCYEVATLGDGGFNVSKPIVLENALLFLDGECIDLAEHTQRPEQNADPAPHSSLSDIGDDADLEDSGTELSMER